MGTKASTKAYLKPENKVKRKSQKQLIDDLFWQHFLQVDYNTEEVGLTYPEVAISLNINKSTAQKRCSDLFKSGRLKITGIRAGYSIYYFDRTTAKLTTSQAYKQALKTYCTFVQQGHIERMVIKLTGKNGDKTS